MSPKGKMFGEATSAVMSVSSLPTWLDDKGRKRMGGRLCLQTRRELLQQLAPQYQRAASAQKREMLDDFTRITGYHRKYAMWLFNHSEEGQPPPARPRPRQYEGAVQEALVQVWNAANRIAAKRLMPFLPMLVEALERHGHLHLSEADRSCLLTMSAATADRLLRASWTKLFWPLHDAPWTTAQATDSHPYFSAVE